METILRPLYFCWILLILLASLTSGAVGNNIHLDRKIKWNPDQLLRISETKTVSLLTFSGSGSRDGYKLLPFFIEQFKVDRDLDSVQSLTLTNLVFSPISDSIAVNLMDIDKITSQVTPTYSIIYQRKIPFLEVYILPLRRNPATGDLERLISFSLQLELSDNPLPRINKSTRIYSGNSVLSSGNWYKFAVASSGVFILTYDFLKNEGIDVASINPMNIRIYGNGGGMLPEANSEPRADDLVENAIFVYGEEDGKFDPGDYILFFGESPDTWKYNDQDHTFHHQKNIYSDKTCYFLNFDLGPGKRLGFEPSTSTTPTDIINYFNDYAFYEKDDRNFLQSGREWCDDQIFDVTTSRKYSFSFANINDGFPVKLRADIAARSTSVSTTFIVSAPGSQQLSISIPPVGNQYTDDYAVERIGSVSFNTSNPVIEVQLEYNKKNNNNAIGFLNYLEMNVQRKLKMASSQLMFRSIAGAGKGKISEFKLTSLGTSLIVWDVSTNGDAKRIETTQSGNDFIFRLPTDTIREFIAFDGSSFSPPEFIGKVTNQNLHGTGQVDYIIVTHPVFMADAERLAQFHSEKSNLNVLVVTPEQIYNEFSSGVQDVSAIRDFMKLLYDRAEPGKEPKYLLLFGDASYDFKDRITNNTNFVPSYQSYESLDTVESFVTDDYYGLLDNNEGQGANGILDLGIGRLPVASTEGSKTSVDKIIHYISDSESVKNDWRNVVCFVADDQNEGGNLFINDSEDLSNIIETGYKKFNPDKIYLDAYQQISTPGGNRYPEVNIAINKRVEKGALIINYVGHGGEVGWAHERVLEVSDINSWTNYNNMPVFITATCEFSRYDDPGRVSAGELVFMNPKGGGVALFTTTRLTFAGDNKVLSMNFYNNAFKKDNGEYHRMGDLIVLSKSGAGSSNARKFTLLGDPALQMAYPHLNVVTTKINGHIPTATPDTLKALAIVTIEGEIQDAAGSKVTSFNGTVFPTVFDKSSEIYTRANDVEEHTPPVKFYLRKNAVYKGQAEVTNGTFSFSFMVPKDIAYNYGIGKISYYARNEETDANGYDENIIVGGYDNSAIPDNKGPEVSLYMNNTSFVSGGITDQNPNLLAYISDESGINTVGNGIGHDITAVIDQKTNTPLILNDYYVADLNTFKSGVITYPFSSLEDGPHHVDLKVWDVFNNSTEVGIDFVVVSSTENAFKHILTYPNPMRDHTTFSFETNQTNQNADVEVRIFSLTGNLVKTIRQSLFLNGYRIDLITWDGTNDQGWRINSGVYGYRIRLTFQDGSVVQGSSKLVVIR